MELSVIDYESPYYAQVLDLRNRLLRVPLGLDLFSENLNQDRDQYIIVVIKEEKIIACIMIQILDKDTVKFRQMAVDETHQKQGIGTMLLGYAENFCVLNDYFTIELHARSLVHEFYLKAGYTIEGEEFEEVGIPHYRMVKDLPISRS